MKETFARSLQHCVHFFTVQLESVDTPGALRDLFAAHEHYQDALLDTGYRKPLSSIVPSDIPEIEQTLKNHVILNVKSELDQFVDGLRVCGIHERVVMYPLMMAACFIPTTVKIDKGMVWYEGMLSDAG